MNSPGKVVNMVHFGQARLYDLCLLHRKETYEPEMASLDHGVDALPQAGNVLYPPYEACDIEDNPGVAKP